MKILNAQIILLRQMENYVLTIMRGMLNPLAKKNMNVTLSQHQLLKKAKNPLL